MLCQEPAPGRPTQQSVHDAVQLRVMARHTGSEAGWSFTASLEAFWKAGKARPICSGLSCAVCMLSHAVLWLPKWCFVRQSTVTWLASAEGRPGWVFCVIFCDAAVTGGLVAALVLLGSL